MGPIEALKIAKEREDESIDLYRKFMFAYPAARDVFEFLLDEEEKHRQIIEKKIIQLEK